MTLPYLVMMLPMQEPTMPDVLQWFATLGVGGILAGMMFFFYRKDVRQHTEMWKTQTTLLVEVVRENTSSNTKLIGLFEALHTRLDDNHREARR